MEKQEFPKMMYHRTEKPVIVQNPGEMKALGSDWAASPAEFAKPAVPDKPAVPEAAAAPKKKPE
jgi:hypothetical protein